MDNERPRSALGAGGGRQKKSNASKKQNVRRADKIRAANQSVPPIQPRIELPEFETGTKVTRNWISAPGLFGDVIKQHGETCVSVSLCGLAQAAYNKDKDAVYHLQFSVEDLDNYVRDRLDTSQVKNLRTVFDYASHPGLLKCSVRRNVEHGKRVGVHCDNWKFATADDVYNMVDSRPIAIGVQISREFCNLKNDIYVMPSKQVVDHAVLVVAKGHTSSGEEFLVIRNSWGDNWGSDGYARIRLKPKDTYEIFWVADILG